MSRRKNHARADAMTAYLREVVATPLLSAEEEYELAGRVVEGDPTARERLVRANLRLVVNIARGHQRRGQAIEDLVSEGNLGLVRAVEGYDRAAGVRFSTYASYWIKQSIRNALMKHGKIVRLPAYMHTLLAKWRRAASALAERLGREPSPEEVGRALGLKARRRRMAQSALETAEAAGSRECYGDFEDDPMGDLVDARSGSVEERVAEEELCVRLAGRLARMEGRGATILRLRFGLGGEEPLTLQAIGERLGLTRERVRQLEREAIAELTRPAVA
jgi:RNA polymerase primary sigma factor